MRLNGVWGTGLVLWFSVGAITKRLSNGACVLSLRNSFALTGRVLTTVVRIHNTECSVVVSYTGGLVLSRDENKNSRII